MVVEPLVVDVGMVELDDVLVVVPEVVDVVDDDEVVSLLLAVLVALFPEMET